VAERLWFGVVAGLSAWVEVIVGVKGGLINYMTNKALPDEIDEKRKEVYGLLATLAREKVRMESDFIESLRDISVNFIQRDRDLKTFIKENIKETIKENLPDMIHEKLHQVLQYKTKHCPVCGNFFRAYESKVRSKRSMVLQCEGCDFSIDGFELIEE